MWKIRCTDIQRFGTTETDTSWLDGMTLSPAQRADVIRRLKPLRSTGPKTENTPTLEPVVVVQLNYLENKRLKSFGTGAAQTALTLKNVVSARSKIMHMQRAWHQALPRWRPRLTCI